MSYRSYALAMGVIFLVIAVLHLLRVIFGWGRDDCAGSGAEMGELDCPSHCGIPGLRRF